jgi:hypothetical protein
MTTTMTTMLCVCRVVVCYMPIDSERKNTRKPAAQQERAFLTSWRSVLCVLLHTETCPTKRWATS